MSAKRESQNARPAKAAAARHQHAARPSALLDTRIIYCGDNPEQLAKLPDGCIDLFYISQIRGSGDPPFNSNRNYEVFWGERSEPRAQASGFHAYFEDRHASTQAYIDYMTTDLAESGGRPRCVGLARQPAEGRQS
jgi:hypothetical protein